MIVLSKWTGCLPLPALCLVSGWPGLTLAVGCVVVHNQIGRLMAWPRALLMAACFFVLFCCSCLSVGGASGLPAEALDAGCWLRIQTGSQSRVCHSVQQQAKAWCLNPHIKMLGVMVFNKSSSSVSREAGALQPQGIGQLMSWALSLNHGNTDWADASLKVPGFLSSFCKAFACLPSYQSWSPRGAPERKIWLKEDHVWDSWVREEGWSPLSAMALA